MTGENPEPARVEHVIRHAWMLAPAELCFPLPERVHLSSLGALLRDPSQSNYCECGVRVHRVSAASSDELSTKALSKSFRDSSLPSHFDDVSKLCIKLIWVSNASRLLCQT